MADGSVIIEANLDTANVSKGLGGLKSELKSVSWNDLKTGNTNAKELGKSFQTAGKSMTLGLTAPIVAGGAAAVAAFNEVDAGLDNVIKATGATGEMAKELEVAYKNVSKNVRGRFEDIGSALGEVNTRFGYTGEKLEAVTTDFMKFSEITGVDATAAVQKVSRFMADAGIEADEYKTILDQLSVAGQASGVSVDTLADSLTKTGAPMRELGFTTEESIALLAQFELAGVNSDQALMAMQKGMVNWTKEGKNAKEEFGNMVKLLRESPDDIDLAAQAYEIFGQKGGVELVDAIRSGRFEYEDMLAVVEGSEGTLDGTFDQMIDGSYEAELAMQNAKVAFAEVGATLMETLAPILQTLAEKLGEFAAWFSNLNPVVKTAIVVVVGLAAALGPVLMIVGSIISIIPALAKGIGLVKTAFMALNTVMKANPIMFVISLIVLLIGWLIDLWNTNEDFRNAVMGIFESIGAAFQAVCDFIMGIWDGVVAFFSDPFGFLRDAGEGIVSWFGDNFPGISETVGSVIDGMQSFFDDPFGALQNATSSVIDFVDGIFPGYKNIVGTVVTGAQEFFKDPYGTLVSATSAVVNKVDSIFPGFKDTVGNVVNGMKEFIKDPFKPLREAVNNIVNWVRDNFKLPEIKFPHIKLPHFSIKGEFSLNPPSIPSFGIDWYAKGGIFNGASVIGVGEAGAEAVVPLTNPRMQPFARAVAENMGSDTGQTIINVRIDSFENHDTDKDAEQLSRTIARKTELRMKAMGLA